MIERKNVLLPEIPEGIDEFAASRRRAVGQFGLKYECIRVDLEPGYKIFVSGDTAPTPAMARSLARWFRHNVILRQEGDGTYYFLCNSE